MDRVGGEDPNPPAELTWRDELEAMTAIGTALEPLDTPARERVLAWAVARYGLRHG